ncbi:protein PFC0760c-like [Xenia sp. Carnegie-2017]|uniref:protein PFC0760c-like n=1 Tax=Xenia sp. Carnegie-2017 TaxID=2897299 RepID=UPI001F033A54|nr:protein PFC0760c-like [Xenia sp. Carnegie-2017]XP_046859595.1 protein PFC0760c-like [Xenia sp. Carnegie-2017]
MKALFILFLLLPAMSLVDSHKRDFEQVDESFDSENMKYIPEKQRELDDKYKLNEENSMMKKTIAAIHQRDGGMEDDNESYDKENSRVEKSKFRQKSSLVEENRYYNKTRDVDRLKQEDFEKMKYQTYDSLQKSEEDDKSDYDVNDNNDDEKNEYKNDGAYLNDDDDDNDDDENEDKNDDVDDDDIDDNYDSDVDDDNNGNIYDKDIDDKSNDDNDMNDEDHDDDVEGDDNKKITSRESYSNEHRENKKESTHNTDKKNSINNKEKSYESKNYDNEENSGTLHLIKNKADKGINHVNEKQNDTEDKHDKNNKEKNVIKDGNDNSNLDSPTLEVKIKQDNNSDVKTRKSKMKIQNGSLKTRANNKTAKDDDVDNSKRKTEHKMENHSTHKNKKSRKNYKVQKGLNRKYDNAMNEYFRTQKQLANTIHKTKDDEKPLNKTDLSFLEANEFSIEKTKNVKDDKEKIPKKDSNES